MNEEVEYNEYASLKEFIDTAFLNDTQVIEKIIVDNLSPHHIENLKNTLLNLSFDDSGNLKVKKAA